MTSLPTSVYESKADMLLSKRQRYDGGVAIYPTDMEVFIKGDGLVSERLRYWLPFPRMRTGSDTPR